MMMEFLNHLQHIAFITAPWLILGLILAALIRTYISNERIEKHLAQQGIWSIFKASIIGAPAPLCSCSVIPVATQLRRSGASKGATAAFLTSTPETGVDSISLSYVLLGPIFAVVRPISAIVSGIVTGLSVHLFAKDEPFQTQSTCACACCCSSKAPEAEPEKTSCCASKPKASIKLIDNLHYSFTTLWGDMQFWLITGILVTALAMTLMPEGFLAQWGSGLGAMVLILLLSLPIYICASASTPIAAGLLLAGLSPGTVLVFMLAGPATNIATLGVLKNELGIRAMWAYWISISIISIVLGLSLDALIEQYNWNITAQLSDAHEMMNPWIGGLSVALLALMSLVRARQA